MENEALNGLEKTPAPQLTPEPDEVLSHGGDGAPAENDESGSRETEVSEGVEPAPTAEEGEAPDEGTDALPDYAATAAEDLVILRREVSELSELSSLSALPDPARYGELRELGLTPTEAFFATAGRGRSERRTQESRAHLASSVGRAASTAGARLSAAELLEARDLFPSLSDREIEALYRRAVARHA